MPNQRQTSRQGLGWLLLPALALTALLADGSPASAGTLDVALLEQSADVLEFIMDKGWKNVGVLPFKVQRGSRASSFSGGPLSHNITRRIENALILSMESNEKKAIGVIRDATGTANQAKVGPFLTNKTSFANLFKTEYPLAWGDRKVTPDGFLIGEVINKGADRGTTRVIIRAFDQKSWDAGKVKGYRVAEFEVRTDRMLAADLGYNFDLNRSLVLKRSATWTPQRRDQAIRDEITGEDEKDESLQPDKGGSQQHTPLNIAGFGFELFYNGEQQPLTPSAKGQGAKSPEYFAPPAPPGGRVNMILTRLTDEERKMGVVIMVNGKSTWKEEDGDALQCHRWIYAPSRVGVRDDFAGFYYDVGGRNLRRFRVLSAEDSEQAALELGGKAGWIEVFVFASREEGGKQDPEMLVSLRGMPLVKSRGLSLASLQKELMKKNNVRLKESKLKPKSVGGLILRELEPEEGGEIDTDNLPNPELVGHLAIRYWESGGKQGGQPQGGQPQRQPDLPQPDGPQSGQPQRQRTQSTQPELP
jgi:hypothetical protein